MTHIQSRLLGAILTAAALAGSALAQADGPEFLVDTTRQLVRSAAFDDHAAAAFNGTNHLIVWLSGSDVRGTLVTPDGTLVDSAGFMVLPSSDCWSLKAAWGGGVFLVAYAWYTGQNYDVRALRLDATGQVLDSGGFVVCDAARDQDEVDVCFNGTDFLVVWDDDRRGGDTVSDIYAARVTPGGVVRDPNGFAVSAGTFEQHEPEVAFDGANCFVVWHGLYDDTSYYDIWGARVAAGGTVIDPDPIRISHGRDDNKTSPDVAFNGSSYLVAWDDATYSHRIYCSRVSSAGNVLDTMDVLVASRSRECEYPAVRANGSDWLVVWGDDIYSSGQNLFGARVSSAGASLDPNGFAVCNAAFTQGGGTLSSDGTNWLVAWADQRQGGSESDIYAARVSSAGVVLEPNGFATSYSVNEQEYSGVASNGTDFLVVWSDGRGDWDIYGARVSSSGAVLDPVPFDISAAAGRQTNPCAAFDGTNYLVVWQDNRDTGNVNLYCARVSPAGAVLDSPAVRLTTTQNDDYWPRMTFDGANYVIVWRYEWYHNVRAMRLTPGLAVLDPNGFEVSTNSSMEVLPDVAAADTFCLITWEQYPNPDDVHGARITRSGVLLDSTPLRIAVAPFVQNNIRVASSGNEWLVVWADQRGLRHNDIYAGIVNLDGSVRDTLGFVVAVSDSGRYKTMPDVVFDGANYLLVWGDDRNHAPTYYDVYGATISPSGAVLDTFAVARSPDRLWYPELAHSSQGAMLSYHAKTGSVNGRAYNGRRVWGKMGPLPGVAELPPQRPARITMAADPNPFTGSVLLRVSPVTEGGTQLVIHDAAGRLVRTLPVEDGGASWDGSDASGRRLPTGVYLVTTAGDLSGAAGKLVLQR